MRGRLSGQGLASPLLLVCITAVTLASLSVSAMDKTCSQTPVVATTDHLSPDAEEVAVHLQTLNRLLDQASPAPMLEHQLCLIERSDTALLATELLSLRHGPEWRQLPIAYLSHHERVNDTNHYRNAQALGRWLGSLRLALAQQKFDRSESATWLRSLIGTSRALHAEAFAGSTNGIDAEPLIQDVGRGRLSLTQALELLAYGEVTSSSVTTVVGQSIRSVERKLPLAQ